MTADPIRIPVEVTTPPPIFELVAKGYDRTQVDEHLLRLEQELAEVAWQRDWLESQRQEVEQERERLRAERESWEAERDAWEPSFAKLGERAQLILSMAQQEADALLEATRRHCEERRARDDAEASAARAAFEQEAAEARAQLRRELDLARLRAEAEANEIVHAARQQAARLTEAARHEAETTRLRGLEYLAAARQERAKTAAMLGDMSDRLRRAAERLSDSDRDVPRRLVVLTGRADDEPPQVEAKA